MTRLPMAKALAPFLMWQGLATQRILHTMGASGMEPKVRLALGTVLVPWAINGWNNQNNYYKQAELSLPEYERNQMHIWLPDFIDPSKPKIDVDGKPVALRLRLWLPDQVAALIGLGNLVPRAERVMSGRDTPMQFAQQSAKMAGDSISGMLVYPQIIQQMLGSSNLSGNKPQGISDRVERVAPLARLGAVTYRTTKNYGLSEGSLKFIEELAGLRTANAMHKGPYILDAQFEDAKKALADAKIRLMIAKRTDPDKAEQALKDVYTAADELRRVANQIKKEQAQGYTPPPPREKTTKAIEVNRQRLPQVLKEIKNERGNQ